MVTRITLGHAEGNVTKCRDKTSYVIELETIHVSRRHFRDILRHCPAKLKMQKCEKYGPLHLEKKIGQPRTGRQQNWVSSDKSFICYDTRTDQINPKRQNNYLRKNCGRLSKPKSGPKPRENHSLISLSVVLYVFFQFECYVLQFVYGSIDF